MFFIENYRKNRHVHQISPAFNFRSKGAKIKWSENLNEAKFEKSIIKTYFNEEVGHDRSIGMLTRKELGPYHYGMKAPFPDDTVVEWKPLEIIEE